MKSLNRHLLLLVSLTILNAANPALAQQPRIVHSLPPGTLLPSDTPGRFILTERSESGATIVNLRHFQDFPDRTFIVHAYYVSKTSRTFVDKLITFDEYLMQVDCVRGTVLLRGGVSYSENGSIASVLTVPPNSKPWNVKDDSDVLSTYAFPQLCRSVGRTARTVSVAGDTWRAAALAVLADLRAR